MCKLLIDSNFGNDATFRRRNGANWIFDILNTPDEEDSIVSACDKLVLSLEEATQNAYDVKQLLLEIKEM